MRNVPPNATAPTRALAKRAIVAPLCLASLMASLVAALTIMTFSPLARAHGTHMPGAKVVLRGGHLAMELSFDVVPYVARHAKAAPGSAPPIPEMLAVLPAEVIAPMIASAEQAFREDLRVLLDGEPVSVRRVTFSSAADVQRRASARLEPGATRGEEDAPAIIVEAMLPRDTGTLSLGFGSELETMIVSFSRPNVQLLSRGATVSFPIDAAAVPPPSPPQEIRPSLVIVTIGALLGAAVLFAAGAWVGRSTNNDCDNGRRTATCPKSASRPSDASTRVFGP